MTSRFTLVAVLSLALAACGSDSSNDSAADTGEAAATDDMAPAAVDAAVEDAAETPEAAASETASPTPTATPTPTPSPTRSAAPAPVAAAGPPDSFKQCSVCHKTAPGENLLGPTLANVFGAKAGHVAGFKYSQAMLDSGLTWNQANLDRFLADPKGVVPNTTMAFPGVKDAAKRAEIIAYLKTL